MKKVAIYIRVSTDAQAEEGYSIDAQKEQLTAYCIAKGMKNYEYYIDGGYSGSTINRPEIQRLISDCSNNKISCVIVFKLDRLSRSQKDTLYLIEDVFNENGVDFVSLNESIDTTSPTGKLMIGILSAFAQLERENIKLRTRIGMKERVKSGLWMGGGKIPFGYNYDSSQGILVPNEDAGKVVQIFQLYLNGMSQQDIANLLGLKYEILIRQILKRKTYYGIIEYNGVEYHGKHEPIISKEMYDAAMKEMKRRSTSSVVRSDHLLTGLVYCGKCGARMRYQKWSKTDKMVCKFVCYSQQITKPYMVKDPNCTQKKLWAKEIEDNIISAMFEFADNYNSNSKQYNIEETDVLSLLEQQRIAITKKLKRLYDLYSDDDSEVLLDSITEQKKKLEDIDERIIEEQNRSESNSIRRDTIKSLNSIRDNWDSLTMDEKRNIVTRIIKEIKITDEVVDVKFNV